MSATINDKFARSQNGGNPTVTTVSGSRSPGGTSLSAVNLDQWPTATPVYFNTYKKTAAGLKDFTTQRSWKAVVSGTTLGTLTIQDGVDDLGNDEGDFIEMGPTAAWGDSLIGGILIHANQDGTLKSGIPTSKLADDGGIGLEKIDWSAFSNNIKWATNSSAPTLTNTNQDLASCGLTLSFTLSGTGYALVTVTLGISSTTDFEFRPEIRLGGVVQNTYTPAAATGSASNRAVVRSFPYKLPLANGVNVVSAGVALTSSTAPSLVIGGGTISAIVFGNVTA